jgi:trk system potassium uptake protein TrkH
MLTYSSAADTVKERKRLTSAQIIILGFSGVILLGALLLTLPLSSRSGVFTPFEDALFTATSAVCVTGLVVRDTATYWSAFGQGVILFLIQIGGMGVITVAASFTILSGKKISLMQRNTMQEALSAPSLGGIVRLTGFAVKATLLFELLGAAALAPVFCRDFGAKGLWMALFHSVSAFCNAGFDLMGIREQFSSLTAYAAQPAVNVTVMLLIITGGIGFLTWDDLRTNRWHWRKYRMQTKVILTSTGLLLVVPAVYFFLREFAALPLNQRVWLSLFQAVTPRTAGFNTADLTTLSEPGGYITMALMLVGGAPGSTAGGMKTTTLAVLLATAAATFRRREDAAFFGRRVDADAVRNAATIFLMYIVLFFGGALAISMLEGLPMYLCLFETASAIGTVGLTLGVTPGLGAVSRLILIGLMFFGRVGGLTLIFAALSGAKKTGSKLPQEKITVG